MEFKKKICLTKLPQFPADKLFKLIEKEDGKEKIGK